LAALAAVLCTPVAAALWVPLVEVGALSARRVVAVVVLEGWAAVVLEAQAAGRRRWHQQFRPQYDYFCD
jgi:hypothetical protein